MSEGYAKPLPHPTVDTEPYWDGLHAGKLMLQACGDCGKVRHYPRPVCDACWSMAVTWVEASGQGHVHSWTVTHHAFHPGFMPELPYTLVTVDLAEGVRVNARLRALQPGELRVGLPVKIGFERVTEDVTLPVVQPA
jgi:uncharacterized OB-fold protein